MELLILPAIVFIILMRLAFLEDRANKKGLLSEEDKFALKSNNRDIRFAIIGFVSPIAIMLVMNLMPNADHLANSYILWTYLLIIPICTILITAFLFRKWKMLKGRK